MDYKIEVVSIPVTDVDRARDFYVQKAGFVLDHDATVDENIRFVQLTPVGSACSIVLGKGLNDMVPGAQKGLMMVVSDVDQARGELVSRGLEVSEVDEQQWGRFIYFADPDGNTWAIQQLPDYSSAEWQEAAAELTDNR